MSFTRVKALKPPKSVFNLSYEKKFDFDMGQLIPVLCEEMVPGDSWKVGNEIVIRFNALFAPILQEVNAYVHYFFVPTRILWDKWEEFITAGKDGPTSDLSGPTLPRLYRPSDISMENFCGPYTLYDYFGFPLVKSSNNNWSFPGYGTTVLQPEYYFRPLAFPWMAVNKIWNEFYRDETLQDERDLMDPSVPLRNWAKDYFTSSLTKQQRGVAPALPISGILPVSFEDADQYVLGKVVSEDEYEDPSTEGALAWVGAADDPHINDHSVGQGSSGISGFYNLHDQNVHASVNLAGAATINVSDLRLIFQVQKWMERNERSGVRYTEFLHAHYGVSPRDDRLQRPEYLGGSKSPIIVSEVVQTSQAANQDTPTGRLYGKAITADKNFVCSYYAKEFGYIVGLLSVMPKPTYQQGVDRQWLRKSRYDFFSPEFSHLSEEEVPTEMLYAFAGTEDNGDLVNPIGNGYRFGYQARYNDMRSRSSKVCGSLRDTLDYWHLGRKFDSVPQLNSDFITCDPTNDDLKRIFQVQNVPGMICNFANIITAIRPIPKFGEPGLIDHN